MFQDPSVTQATNSNMEAVDQYNPFPPTVRHVAPPCFLFLLLLFLFFPFVLSLTLMVIPAVLPVSSSSSLPPTSPHSLTFLFVMLSHPCIFMSCNLCSRSNFSGRPGRSNRPSLHLSLPARCVATVYRAQSTGESSRPDLPNPPLTCCRGNTMMC